MLIPPKKTDATTRRQGKVPPQRTSAVHSGKRKRLSPAPEIREESTLPHPHSSGPSQLLLTSQLAANPPTITADHLTVACGSASLGEAAQVDNSDIKLEFKELSIEEPFRLDCHQARNRSLFGSPSYSSRFHVQYISYALQVSTYEGRREPLFPRHSPSLPHQREPPPVIPIRFLA